MDVALKCKCGSFSGIANEIYPERGNHIICRCDDCRAYGKYLGREGILDEKGGTEIFQTTPSQLKFEKGIENLSCVRLSEKGLLRWYTSCCKTPVGNTMASSKVPFVGVVHTIMDLSPKDRRTALGPVLSDGKPSEAGVRVLLRFLRLLLAAWLAGKAKSSPFFREGKPIVEPRVLPKNERLALA